MAGLAYSATYPMRLGISSQCTATATSLIVFAHTDFQEGWRLWVDSRRHRSKAAEVEGPVRFPESAPWTDLRERGPRERLKQRHLAGTILAAEDVESGLELNLAGIPVALEIRKLELADVHSVGKILTRTQPLQRSRSLCVRTLPI